jgi:hypothetical protein
MEQVDHKMHGQGRGNAYLRSVFFASDVDGSASRRDWLGPMCKPPDIASRESRESANSGHDGYRLGRARELLVVVRDNAASPVCNIDVCRTARWNTGQARDPFECPACCLLPTCVLLLSENRRGQANADMTVLL